MSKTKLRPRLLRRIAENVLGVDREMALCFVADQGAQQGSESWQLLDPTDSRVKPDDIVIEPDRVNDITIPPGKFAPPESVKIVYKTKTGTHGENDNLVANYDAAFWRRPAMEKFLVDYYLPLLDPIEFHALHFRIMGLLPDTPTLFAILHTYPSIPETLEGETEFLTEQGLIPEKAFVEEAKRAYLGFLPKLLTK